MSETLARYDRVKQLLHDAVQKMHDLEDELEDLEARLKEENGEECEGHPAGPFDPMGQTVYCDGCSCRSVNFKPAREPQRWDSESE